MRVGISEKNTNNSGGGKNSYCSSLRIEEAEGDEKWQQDTEFLFKNRL